MKRARRTFFRSRPGAGLVDKSLPFSILDRMRREPADILSARDRADWSVSAPSILTPRQRPSGQLAAGIVRTLFDRPRRLEPCHLYDERGSLLFEEICELPEYYPTRTEAAILEREAGALMSLAPVECIVELGAGFSRKTIHLLKALSRARGRGTFTAVDVSATALMASRSMAEELFPELAFTGLEARFEDAITSITGDIPKLVVFLGSTIGNFTPTDMLHFFTHLCDHMGPDDYLLLGIDRIKEPAIIEPAYDDSRGVTAAFILNAFNNVNRVTGANFRPEKIAYRSGYNQERAQVEMCGIATETHRVDFPRHSASFAWEEGDGILVETSRKFDPDDLQVQLRSFGLDSLGHWTDPNQWFSLLLFRRSGKAGDGLESK